MKTFIFLFAFAFSSFAQVPEDLRLRGSMRKLPLSLSVNPQFQFQKKKTKTLYSFPVRMENPSLSPARDENGWWEIKSKTKTKGIGFKIPVEMKPGLAIYKGSSQTSIRHVQNRAPAGDNYIFPSELGQVAGWQNGDSGNSESYGGIIARMSFRINGFPSVTASVGIQNSFRLTLRKLEDRKVELLISEEKLSERVIKTSLEIVKLSFAHMKNKKLSFRFIMDPKLLSHQKLYQSALKGDLTKLQSALESSRQNVSWIATEKKISVGHSLVRKEIWSWTNLYFTGTQDLIYMRTKTSKGKLSLNRSWVDYILIDDKGITLHWTHQMKKMNEGRFRQFFLKPLNEMGIFTGQLHSTTGVKFGKVLTEISVYFERDELESLPEFQGKSWKTIRRKIGMTLLNNPHRLPILFPGKDVRVKFWSDTLQSFEGNFSLGSALPAVQ